jgi:photosystem II stability/assembly factor-like uncharacterized protein
MFRPVLTFVVCWTTFLGCILSTFVVSSPTFAQQRAERLNLDWEIGPTGSKASFRGISTPSASTVWLCGSQSTVLRSIDGGESWFDCSPGLGELEIRSIVAHSAIEACIASAGTPAVILTTVDAGQSWKEVYRNDSKSAFFDGMKFWNQRQGIAFSDPIDGKFLIVETVDGGQTWRQIDPATLPEVLTGEAAFAASNSSLLIGSEGQVWIGTGGSSQSSSRIFHRKSWQAAWQVQTAPIPSDTASGIFSLAMAPSNSSGAVPMIVAVGGDYRPDANSPVVCVLSNDNGRTWQIAKQSPQQFRSAVVATSGVSPGSLLWITVGPTGSDYSTDGHHWLEFSSHGFHTLSSFQQQIFAAGPNGKFAKLKVRP